MQLKIIQRTIHGKNLVLFIFRKFEIHILVSNAPPLNFWLIYSPLMPRLHICKSLARSRPLSRGFKRASWSMTDVESATFYYYVLDTVAYAFTTQIHTRREERKGGGEKKQIVALPRILALSGIYFPRTFLRTKALQGDFAIVYSFFLLYFKISKHVAYTRFNF